MEPDRERWYQQRIAELEAQVDELKAGIARLTEQVARLSKNSSDSSKPPSSDIVKPPKPKPKKDKKKRKRRRIGGQPGHPKHEREPFSIEDLHGIWEYELGCCPDCGGRVTAYFNSQPAPSLLPEPAKP